MRSWKEDKIPSPMNASCNGFEEVPSLPQPLVYLTGASGEESYVFITKLILTTELLSIV